MIFKKHGKDIFGVSFTDKEQEIIDREIEKQAHEKAGEMLKSLEDDVDAQILWFLHRHCGFGKKRLIEAYYGFRPYIDELQDYYDMPQEGGFIAAQKLKEIGVDLEEMRKGEANG